MSRKPTPAGPGQRPAPGGPTKPNSAARLIIPLIAAAIAVAFALAFFFRGDNTPPPETAAPDAPAAVAQDTPAPEPADSDPAPTPTLPPATTPALLAEASRPTPDTAPAADPARPADPAASSFTPIAQAADAPQSVSIGSSDPDSGFKLKIDLMPYGAAVRQIAFAEYNSRVHHDAEPLVLSQPLSVAGPADPDAKLPHFAARQIVIDGKPLTQANQPGTLQSLVTVPWTLVSHDPSHATYQLTIVDQPANTNQPARPLVRLTRTYRVGETYDVSLEQTIDNLAGRPLNVRFSQFAQGDLEKDRGAYLGDRRLFAFGYFNPAKDPRKVRIWTDDSFVLRNSVADDFAQPIDARPDDEKSIWPSRQLDEDIRSEAQLAWLASENRYFAVVVHAPIPPGVDKPVGVTPLTQVFPHVDTFVLPNEAAAPDLRPDNRSVLFAFHTDDLTLQPGGSIDLSLGFFAGPRKAELLAEAPYAILNLGDLVRYEIPGPCTFCTFQWLARGLLWFLALVHSVLGDWGIAIILLVATVRLILHPITKRAQVNMMKMGKQMQALQPELEKIKTKHKDDPTKLNKEMMALYREKGINPANMLGCLPMLLQTPIWIALYAMLYFAIELRHEPAFYGVFQAISGGAWPFLADLSVPDRFIPILDEPAYFSFPLLPLQFDYSSINILPLLMGVTFFINAKFTSPPPANEQQAQQQKIMKFVTLLFPIFLYGAPAGLTLYIFTSTLAGIVDSYIVRRHVRIQEEAGTLFDKKPRKPRKPGGFMDRLQNAAEAQQARLEEMKALRDGSAPTRKKSSPSTDPPPPGAGPRPPRRKR